MAPLDRVLPAATAEILLVAVAVVAGIMVAMIVMPIADQSTEKGPVSVLEATANESAIELCHDSGANLLPEDLVISLETESGEKFERAFSDARAGADYEPSTFGAGECVAFDAPPEGQRISVTVRHEPTNKTLLFERVDLEANDPLITG